MTQEQIITIHVFSGIINCADWSFAMETVLEMELPWRTLKSKLAQTDNDGNVLYETSFETLQVKHRYSGVTMN